MRFFNSSGTSVLCGCDISVHMADLLAERVLRIPQWRWKILGFEGGANCMLTVNELINSVSFVSGRLPPWFLRHCSPFMIPFSVKNSLRTLSFKPARSPINVLGLASCVQQYTVLRAVSSPCVWVPVGRGRRLGRGYVLGGAVSVARKKWNKRQQLIYALFTLHKIVQVYVRAIVHLKLQSGGASLWVKDRL